MKNILLIGLGRFGKHIAIQSSQLGHEIMAVDLDEERVNDALPYVTNAQIGDSTNEEFLKSLGIANYDICFVTIGGNFQNSLETTCLLKELGGKMVISRAERDVQEKFLLRNGADKVVYPEKMVAKWATIRYTDDHILDYMEVDASHAIFEVEVPREWIGKTVGKLDIRKKYDIDENDIVFVYSGRLSPEKGVLEAVKAFSKTNLSNAKLLIIGGIWYGCNKVNDYFKQLKEFSNSNVIFTGYVLHNEIEKYLCASDIGLVPSICNEAAGLSVVEFMARKNLVIASNRGGIKEYMNSQNILIDFDSTDELIDKMRKEMKNISVSLKERNDNLEFSKKFSKEANYLMIASILGE